MKNKFSFFLLFLIQITFYSFSQNIETYKVKVGYLPLRFDEKVVLSQKERKDFEDYLDKMIPKILDSMQTKTQSFEFVGKIKSSELPQNNLLLLQQEIAQESGKILKLSDTINTLTTIRVDGYTKEEEKIVRDLNFRIDNTNNYDILRSCCFMILPEPPPIEITKLNIKKIKYVIDVKYLKGKDKNTEKMNTLFKRILYSESKRTKELLLTSLNEHKDFLSLIKDKMLFELSLKDIGSKLLFEIQPKTKSKNFISIDMSGKPIVTSFKLDKSRFEKGDYLEFILKTRSLMNNIL